MTVIKKNGIVKLVKIAVFIMLTLLSLLMALTLIIKSLILLLMPRKFVELAHLSLNFLLPQLKLIEQWMTWITLALVIILFISSRWLGLMAAGWFWVVIFCLSIIPFIDELKPQHALSKHKLEQLVDKASHVSGILLVIGLLTLLSIIF